MQMYIKQFPMRYEYHEEIQAFAYALESQVVGGACGAVPCLLAR